MESGHVWYLLCGLRCGNGDQRLWFTDYLSRTLRGKGYLFPNLELPLKVIED